MWWTGGLDAENGTVSGSHATGSVSGTGNYVGGLVGNNDPGPRSAAATPPAE